MGLLCAHCELPGLTLSQESVTVTVTVRLQARESQCCPGRHAEPHYDSGAGCHHTPGSL